MLWICMNRLWAMTRRSECAIRTKRHTLRRACQIYSDIRLDDEMIFFLEYLLLEEESAPKRPSSRRKGIFDTAAEAEAFFPRNRFFRHSTLFFEKTGLPVISRGWTRIWDPEIDSSVSLFLGVPSDPGDEALNPAVLRRHDAGLGLK